MLAYVDFVYNKYNYNQVIDKKSRYNSSSTDTVISSFFQHTNKKNAEWLSLQYEQSKINYEGKYHYYNEDENIESLESATIKTKTNLHTITDIVSNKPNCSCYEMQTMQLPCRHIFII